MNPKLILVAINILRDEKNRQKLIYIVCFAFFFLVAPILYVANNPGEFILDSLNPLNYIDINSIMPVNPTMTEAGFIQEASAPAVATQKKYGVYASVTMAQAILESGWGKSGLATKANNYFGIKAIGGWTGQYVTMQTHEEENGVQITINANFRFYISMEESFEDHGKFLKDNKRYSNAGVFTAKDYIGQAQALQKAGYATESDYASSVITLVKKYNLNIYDTAP